ncbi:hypothetical protein [Pontibacter mangrovi]|uniref:CcoQ/FixQ family Cbb3-type cytochrome c oxidase assembly chaperone n=1 Tax=Pontibacter mangrovi TaxID=2589816 RepID=A0A501W7J2_9BACT|nr:hypothetical protein [Pontibacter mangrovi]TPE45903.1 hypothetical protein FJM65_00735 [Pontibacter mangrovi]
MYKNVLEAIDGIEIYPIISFSIFFIFFLGLLLYVSLLDKKHVEAMSQIPCAQDNDTTPKERQRQ